MIARHMTALGPTLKRRTSGLACLALLVWAPVVHPEEQKDDMHSADAPHANRLIHSLSPYLLQHAHNPVDWYPWGPEALDRARREHKPIFLSIGYSACHWCHVMEHESFEDPQVAEVLNAHFVSIKVDREERPDIDELYMQATLAMVGSGGWPMSVFLKPDGAPFWAGTYIRRDAFVHLASRIAETWERDPEEIDRVSSQLKAYLEHWAQGPKIAAGVPGPQVVRRTAAMLAGAFDLDLGGLRAQGGNGNKFPPSMAMELMLRVWQTTGDAKVLRAVEVTLDKMADGGIYDHLGGGICRYSTDPYWRVPHFEKMLYDQALVSSIYLDGFQVFSKPRYAEVARGILDYVLEDLQSPQGGFYSTRDADSDGLEGQYYIWTVDEVHAALGEVDGPIFCAAYDVTATGNWSESLGHAPPGPKNILNIKRDLDTVAAGFAMAPHELRTRLNGMRAVLRDVRRRRTAPGLDDKILTAWNGLMIASLAKAASVLNEPRYAAAAARAADFVLEHLRRDGRLLRTYRHGESRLTAYLSDYAFFIEGLLNLHEATYDLRWLDEATALAETCNAYYADPQNGGFFFTARDAESLIVRTRNPRDGAIPSGNSVHAMNLLRLQIMLDRSDFRTMAESIFRGFAGQIEQSPAAFERLLCALDFYHARKREIVLAASDRQQLSALIEAAYSSYLPNKVVSGVIGGSAPDAVALLRGKKAIANQPTVFVCENYACKAPVHEPAQLKALLWPPPEKATGSVGGPPPPEKPSQ